MFLFPHTCKIHTLKKQQALFIFFCLPVLLMVSGFIPTAKLKWLKKYSLKISEPSDICYSASTNTYFAVSDGGYLYETDENGIILRKAPYSGLDFEGVFADSSYVYVMEEMTRTIIAFDKTTLSKTGIRRVNYHGARNKGYEAITYNEAKKCFVIITERDPVWIHELDENFLVKNEIQLKKVSDISAATFYQGKLYLLSDEDHCVLQVNPLTYSIEKKYKLNVINPEGICFAPDGTMKIISDDMGMLFNYRLMNIEVQ
jgi:uncharacterized protein YjiK